MSQKQIQIIILFGLTAIDDTNKTVGPPDFDNFDVEGNAIAIDCNGNLYITGYFGSNGSSSLITIDAISLTTTAIDAFVINVDPSTGYFNWAVQTTANNVNNDTESYAITTDCNGFVYITGTYYQNIEFDFNVFTSFTSLNYDAFVAQIDPSIQGFSWAISSQGHSADCDTEGFGIVADCKNNLYITGYASGLVYFFGENGSFEPVIIDDQCGTTLFVAKLDSINFGNVFGLSLQ